MKAAVLFTALYFAHFSYASEKVERSEWFQCSKDEDCVDIAYYCAGATVNKKFAKEANEHYRRLNSTLDCVEKPGTEKNIPPFKVFCKERKCGSQGKNPKVGFS